MKQVTSVLTYNNHACVCVRACARVRVCIHSKRVEPQVI